MLARARFLIKHSDIWDYPHEQSALIISTRSVGDQIKAYVEGHMPFDWQALDALMIKFKLLTEQVRLERLSKLGHKITEMWVMTSPEIEQVTEYLDSLSGRMPEDELDLIFNTCLLSALGDNQNG